jgi:ribosomal protein L7/L12
MIRGIVVRRTSGAVRMVEQHVPSSDGESADEGPYADHPVLSALPCDVRQQIADQLKVGKKIGAIALLREAIGTKEIGLRDAKDIIDGLQQPGGQAQSGASTWQTKLASGRIDKAGTTLALYRDGTFTTMGLFRTSDPDRLVAFSSDIDSMRRKSVTGRGAAALVTGGMSVLASNNRGVIYVTITGERSGTKTYTTKNPENKLLSTIRSLQTAADHLLASPSAVVTASDEDSATATQRNDGVAAQLKMLAELHASGALSDEEFATAKARVLS